MPRIKDEGIIALIFFLSVSIIIPVHALALPDASEINSGDNEITPSSDSFLIHDSLKDDTAVSSPLINDTSSVDSVILEPNHYSPGLDTMLIKAYALRDTASSGGKSPTLMLLNSVVFPGGGQYSNGKYLKAAVVFGAEIYFIYRVLRYSSLASEWRQKWKSALDSNHPSGSMVPALMESSTVIDTSGLRNIYFEEYTSHRDTRNTYLWYTALTVFLSMFDAYVDAHLQNFPKGVPGSDKLSVDVVPGEDTRLSLRYNF